MKNNAGSAGLVVLAVVALIVLALIIKSAGTIEAGHRGIVLRMGAVQDGTLKEGFYSINPLTESVKEVEVRVQKVDVKTEGASKDLQTIKAEVALNYSIDPERAGDLFKKIGIDFQSRVIVPTLLECIKSVTAQYTAEELITKREIVRLAIKTAISSRLTPDHIRVEEVNVIDFDFSDSFNRAIEAKVTAEQSALAAKNKLAQIEFEAQQHVAEARGKADAMKLEAEAMRTAPEIMQLRAMEKWNGVLPQVMGGNGGMPFINLQPAK